MNERMNFSLSSVFFCTNEEFKNTREYYYQYYLINAEEEDNKKRITSIKCSPLTRRRSTTEMRAMVGERTMGFSPRGLRFFRDENLSTV